MTDGHHKSAILNRAHFSALAFVECTQAATVFIADRLPEVIPHNVI